MIVGISARSLLIDEKKKYFINECYILCFKKYGLIPILLFNQETINSLGPLCDGFMILGGGDVSPSLYNQDNISSYDINEEIDSLDYQIIKYSIDKNKPLMGICRGIQVINTFFGGTLKQDIERIHFKNTRTKIKIENSKYFHDNIAYVNSYHHQAIDLLGKDLFASGYSDGEIEIVEHLFYPIIAFQFHPELLNNDLAEKIFKIFRELKEDHKC